MSSGLLNLSTSDITGRNSHNIIPTWTDKYYIPFIVFADIQSSFMSNQMYCM